MLTIGMSMQGLDKVRAEMARLSGPQMREAYAKGINDTAKHRVRPDMQAEMRSSFDRVTPFIENSVKVFPATPDSLEATVAPTRRSDLGTKGGKVGTDPQQVLQAQEAGGLRRDKRSEVALRQAGILPSGWQTAIPAESRGGPFPGSADAYGNLNGPFLRSVLSYLQTYQPGVGYVQNMKKEAQGRMRAYGRATVSKRAQQQAGPFMGRRYFVSYGERDSPYGKGIVRRDSGELDYGRNRSRHIGAGIWAAMGGRKVRAVLIFIKPRGGYRPRLKWKGIAESATTQEYLARRLRFRIREAAEA